MCVVMPLRTMLPLIQFGWHSHSLWYSIVYVPQYRSQAGGPLLPLPLRCTHSGSIAKRKQRSLTRRSSPSPPELERERELPTLPTPAHDQSRTALRIDDLHDERRYCTHFRGTRLRHFAKLSLCFLRFLRDATEYERSLFRSVPSAEARGGANGLC